MTPETGGTRPDFMPLPGDPGGARRVGVEIEFGGLAPAEAAAEVAAVFGGAPEERGPEDLEVSLPEGAARIYLDTALRPEEDGALARLAVDLASAVVPVEIVLPPVQQDRLAQVQRLIDGLDRAGAEGSREGLLSGFGLHLNVELADVQGGSDLPRVARAFALLERWLRHRDPPDVSRRLLPFIAPFPEALVTALAEAAHDIGLADFLELFAGHVSGRNHGLDLLPAFAALDPQRFARLIGEDDATKPRPAYHYRLPECRLGEADWSLAYEWNRWALVEHLAADRAASDRMAAAWLRHHRGVLVPDMAGYLAAAGEIVAALDLPMAEAEAGA